MSMLSAQCDELRKLALWLDDEFYDVEATKVREAADTIWELRCKLSGMVDERERARVAEAENAKLRELVKHTWLFANRAHEAAYELCPDRSDPHALATISALTLNAQDVAVRMRELGVEV